jgi:WhiB family redox-sensing transcriptional regulator
MPIRDERYVLDLRKLWPSWHANAACRGEPNDSIFFGEPRDGVYQPSGIKEAKAKCNSCPVFAECLRYALENREPWGIWASTTMRERALIFDGLDAGLFTLEEIIQDRLEARDEQL